MREKNKTNPIKFSSRKMGLLHFIKTVFEDDDFIFIRKSLTSYLKLYLRTAPKYYVPSFKDAENEYSIPLPNFRLVSEYRFYLSEPAKREFIVEADELMKVVFIEYMNRHKHFDVQFRIYNFLHLFDIPVSFFEQFKKYYYRFRKSTLDIERLQTKILKRKNNKSRRAYIDAVQRELFFD